MSDSALYGEAGMLKATTEKCLIFSSIQFVVFTSEKTSHVIVNRIEIEETDGDPSFSIKIPS